MRSLHYFRFSYTSYFRKCPALRIRAVVNKFVQVWMDFLYGGDWTERVHNYRRTASGATGCSIFSTTHVFRLHHGRPLKLHALTPSGRSTYALLLERIAILSLRYGDRNRVCNAAMNGLVLESTLNNFWSSLYIAIMVLTWCVIIGTNCHT